jgi:hypothetical protein
VFNKELEEGYSYTLVISFKKTLWAKSNIYWDEVEQKLTFDTYENSHQGYQGVFFKYGSLVGVSPARVGGSDDYAGQDVPIYVPVVEAPLENSFWVATTGPAVTTDIPGAAHNWTTWGENTNADTDIPYLDRFDYAGSDYSNRSNMHAIDLALNDPETMWAKYRGDICQYLSATGSVEGNWRLPTSADFGTINTTSWASSNPTTTANSDGWIKGMDPFPTANTAVGKADGTADIVAANLGSAISRPLGDLIFPASGYRNGRNGVLANVGSMGYSWSGSANSTVYGYRLYFTNSVVQQMGSIRSAGLSVRCVRN